MGLLSFFSKQARKPKGFFGRVIMSTVYNIGNAKFNEFVYEMMSVHENDHILEIGFGTGKLINKIARQLKHGIAEGIDFSETMVSIARQRNRQYIEKGRVNIFQGDFNSFTFKKESYDKVCSVNTIYFWDKPALTAKKIADIMKPKGKLIIGFEDVKELEKRKLDYNVFHLYSVADVKGFLLEAGFKNGIKTETRILGSAKSNCMIAVK